VFLTAGHCFDTGTRVGVIFAATLPRPPQPPPTIYRGTAFQHPAFCAGCDGPPAEANADIHDLTVVVLDAPVPASVVGRYARLPAPGLVDRLAMRTPLTLVGYGTTGYLRGGGQPQPTGGLDRLRASTLLIADRGTLSPAWLKLMMNPSHGQGGICFGDSGGPDLLGGTDVVLAVNSFVASFQCTGVGYGYRVDTPSALTFIRSFLP
jgi:hypothetical protein